MSQSPKFKAGTIKAADGSLYVDIEDGRVAVWCTPDKAGAVTAALQAANIEFEPYSRTAGVGFQVAYNQESTLDKTRDRVFATLSVVTRLADSSYRFEVGGYTLALNLAEGDEEDDAYLLTITAEEEPFPQAMWEDYAAALRNQANPDAVVLAIAGFEFHEVGQGGILASIPLVDNLGAILGYVAKLLPLPQR